MKSEIFEFNLKTNTKIGAGASLELGRYLKEFNFKRIGLLIDRAIYELPLIRKIINRLKREGFEKQIIWKYDLKFEPDYESLDKIKRIFLEKEMKPKVDCFVGIGGGSVIDFAKALSTVTVNPGRAIDYRGFPTNINPSLPTIAIPTTAGTGSELTYNASLIDWQDKKKLGINTLYNYPVLAILDPLLTLSCPLSVTVSSGADALVHAVESHTNKKSTNFSRIFSREAFRLIFNGLWSVSEKPKDLKIRSNLQLGAYLAGISIICAGGGPACALSYPLGVHFKVAHGLAGGVFLLPVIEYNISRGYDYSQLYDLWEKADGSASIKKKNQLFSRALFELYKKLGIPFGLERFSVNRENIAILLKETESMEKSFALNPVPFSVQDGKNLLKKMIS